MSIEESNLPNSHFSGMLWDGVKGGMLGGLVVTCTSPLLYAKNRWQTKQLLIFKDCMKGAPLMALSVIPQAFIVLSVNAYMQNKIANNNGGRELTNGEKFCTAIFAGGISGAASAPFEFGAQNLQNKWQKSLREVFTVAVNQKGPRILFTGSIALIFREAIYAPGYIFASHWLSGKLTPYIQDKTTRDVTGAALAGAIVGAITAPLDTLRANKQYMKNNWGYLKTIKVLRIGIFAGVIARVGALMIANTMMSLGAK
jgi:hypothetical protein